MPMVNGKKYPYTAKGKAAAKKAAAKVSAKDKAPAARGMAKKQTMAKGPAAMPKMMNKKPGKAMR